MTFQGPTASHAGLYRLCSRPMSVAPTTDPEEPGAGAFERAAHWIMYEVVMGDPARWQTGPAHLMEDALKLHGLDVDEWGASMAELRPIAVASAVIDEHPTAVAEVAYALDLDTPGAMACTIGNNIGRAYTDHGAQVEWVKGTADMVWVEGHPGDQTLVLRDWKFGSPDNVDPVEDNLQMITLGVMAWDVRDDCEHLRLEICFVLPGQPPLLWQHTFEKSEREFLRAEVIGIWDRQLDQTPTPGPHCYQRWCPLRGECPEAERAMAELIVANPPEDAESEALLDPTPHAIGVDAIQNGQQAAAIYLRYRMAKNVLKVVENSLHQWAEQNGDIEIGGGRVWGMRQETSESIRSRSQSELLAALKDILPPDIYEATAQKVEVGLTKEALYEAAGSDNMKRVLTTLRKRSLVTLTMGKSFREEVPRGRKGQK